MSEESPVFFMKAYLWAKDKNWSEEQVDELMSRFADFLVENGFGSVEGEDEPINSLVLCGQEYQPDEVEVFLQNITTQENADVTCILVPKQ